MSGVVKLRKHKYYVYVSLGFFVVVTQMSVCAPVTRYDDEDVIICVKHCVFIVWKIEEEVKVGQPRVRSKHV